MCSGYHQSPGASIGQTRWPLGQSLAPLGRNRARSSCESPQRNVIISSAAVRPPEPKECEPLIGGLGRRQKGM
jgi:hypothetical protein